jgi:hypothetical protein
MPKTDSRQTLLRQNIRKTLLHEATIATKLMLERACFRCSQLRTLLALARTKRAEPFASVRHIRLPHLEEEQDEEQHTRSGEEMRKQKHALVSFFTMFVVRTSTIHSTQFLT